MEDKNKKEKIIYNSDNELENDYIEYENNEEVEEDREKYYYDETIELIYLNFKNFIEDKSLPLCEFINFNKIKLFLEKNIENF